MDKIFASRPGRRKFLLTIFSILFSLILIRNLILPGFNLSENTQEVIGSIIDKFTTSVFTAVIVGYFMFWIQSDEKKKHLEFTESEHEIEKYLKASRLSANIWNFNGGLGRYTRSDTIPKLSQLSSAEKRTISLNLIVINPSNTDLVDKYIHFRSSLEPAKSSRVWKRSDTQAEILATIVTALYFKKRNQFLYISIRVKDFFTLSRMDISDSIAVITREDPNIPSIVAEKDSYLYKHYSEEFQQVGRQSKIINYDFSSLEKPTIQEIEHCIMRVFPDMMLTKEILSMVYEKFVNPVNPFA